jgi:hypothetical protein
MPLHDWAVQSRWPTVRHVWLVELLRSIKPRLPVGYRAWIESSPMLSAEDMDAQVDPSIMAGVIAGQEPDYEVPVPTLHADKAIFVTGHGRLTAVIELISPRHKDDAVPRTAHLGRWLNYLTWGVNLVLIDVHRRPLGFSFADAFARELKLPQKPLPSPMGIAYRVGGDGPDGGQFLAAWAKPFAVGEPLPAIPLPLTTTLDISLPLEQTYARAAADAYLD